MKLLGLKSFAHGVHPPESKDATKNRPIEQFPFAPVLIVPLQQHVGRPAVAEVSEDEEVVRGQRIARPDGDLSVAMHAPVSGVVRRLALAPTIKGVMAPSVFIEPYAASTQEIGARDGCPLDADPEAILNAIQMAGIVGLGGAAFPTHAKLRLPAGAAVDTVVVNGAECEPYLTTDHRVMLECPDEIFTGIRYVLRVTGASRAIIGVETNKADAAELLERACPPELPVSVERLAVKYPQGAEKILISSLLGREVPSGGLPYDVGALCINVSTTAEIGQLLPTGRGIQERVVTVGGPAIKRPGNFRIPIGTPLRFLLETVGVHEGLQEVFLGGPMMGASAPSLDIPIVKGTTGVVAFTEQQAVAVAAAQESPCIRCAYCIEACPLGLNPAELGALARNRRFETMAEQWHLLDCFECGCCTFVCPSNIPLVQHFRVAKAAVRKKRARP